MKLVKLLLPFYRWGNWGRRGEVIFPLRGKAVPKGHTCWISYTVSSLHTLSPFILTPTLLSRYYYPHVEDVKTEAQRRKDGMQESMQNFKIIT